MECPINLKECEMFCNEKQIFPAMKHFVEECGLSVRGAARQVRKLTGGKVTDRRAAKVYHDRTGATLVAPKSEPTQKTDKKKDVNNEYGSVSQVFADAYDTFYKTVQNEKMEKWINTGREVVLKKIDNLIDLVQN